MNVDVGFLHQFLTSDKALYVSYGKLIGAGTRIPAAPDNDRQRTAVEAILFGSWGTEITYAALALDGRGLGTYGPISMELKPVAVDLRASVLEENSFSFVTRHALIPGKPIPRGYRAPWDTRREVGVAKVADRITPATTVADFARLILNSDGSDRSKDELIEVHIFGPFNRSAVQRITVLSIPKDPADRHRLKSVKKAAKGIQWSGPS